MRIVPTNTLSGRGSGPGQFQVRITGLALDDAGTLFALGDRGISIFDARGDLVGSFSTSDAGWSICWSDDALWIGLQGAIESVDRTGRVLDRIADSQLGLVTGVAVLGDLLLAADATNKRLALYERGVWKRHVGLETNTRGFMIPNGVLVAAADVEKRQFVVAHPQKHRVERYDADGSPAGWFGKFGNEAPEDFGGCCNPNTIAASPGGLVIVSEKAPPRIKVFSREGAFLAASPDGVFDSNAKNLALAATDARVFAADPARCTIQAFDIIDDAVEGSMHGHE
jgi:hypothetical protein